MEVTTSSSHRTQLTHHPKQLPYCNGPADIHQELQNSQKNTLTPAGLKSLHLISAFLLKKILTAWSTPPIKIGLSA